MKLFCFDIDGTLQTSNKEITSKTKEALKYIKKQGDDYIIATGRHISTCFEPIFHADPQYIIASGGGAIYKLHPSTEVIKISYLNEITITKVRQYAKEHKRRLLIFTDVGSMLLTNGSNDRLNEYDRDVLKLPSLDTYTEEEIIKMHPKVNKLVLITDDNVNKHVSKDIHELLGGKVNVSATPGGFIDINNIKDNKYTAIKVIKEIVGATEIITFGDSMNDYAMTKNANIGIAMANSYEELKEVADFIVASNDDEGIYEGVMKVYRK